MTVFLVTYDHPDAEGWKRHLAPHLRWIIDQVHSGALLASGPTYTGDTRTAALLFKAADRRVVEETIATDPFVQHGQVSNMSITVWDPIFGMLNPVSSAQGQDAEEIASDMITAVGAQRT